MDYFNARSLQLRTGRFNRPDPLAAGAMGNPQGWNRYTYVGNSPLVFTDPTGLTNEDPVRQSPLPAYHTHTIASGLLGYTHMSGLNGSDDSGDHNAWAVALALGIGSAVGRAGAAGVHAFARAGRPSSNTTDGGDTDDPGESGGGDDRGDDGQQKKKEDPCAKPPYPAGTSLDRNIRVSSIAILPGQRLSNFASWLVAVAPHSSSDYKNQCKTPTGTYEAAGNHNFGATGAAMGFSAATLHAAAGMVALMSDWTRVFTQSPHYFWDSPEDWGQIQRGIDYYSKGCSAK